MNPRRDVDRDLFVDYGFLDNYLEDFVNYRDNKDYEGVLDTAWGIRNLIHIMLSVHNLSTEDKKRLCCIVKNVNYDIKCLLEN